MQKDDHSQIYQMLSVLFLTLSKGQQVQQCIREVLTSHPLFSPLPLFKYIARGNSVVKKEHIQQFLEENSEVIEEQQLKNVMEFMPGLKSWQYKDFIEFVYPFNSAVLREISHMHLKRYPKLQKYGVPESALSGFLLLLTEQISLIRKLETQKCDSWQKIPKERLRKVLLSIKKAGEKQPSHCQNDERRITSLELRNFMKAFVSVEDSHFLFLSRRLGIRNGFFMIQELEKFIKPGKKSKKHHSNHTRGSKVAMPVLYVDEEDNDFDEKKYKENILEQMAANEVSDRKALKGSSNFNATMVVSHKNQQQQQRSQSQKGKEPNPATNSNINPLSSAINTFMNPSSNRQQHFPPQNQSSDNYFMPQKHKLQPKRAPPKELLIKFIQSFLPASRRLEELKNKLLQHRVDFFKLFKVIDRSNRGVVGAEDLMEYYRWVGGRMHFDLGDFQLLIDRHAQSGQPWITLGEFCEMVKGQDKQSIGRTIPVLGDETNNIVIRIIEVVLENERQLVAIRKQFKRDESRYLFSMINRQQTGFINYQELKKFLNQSGLQLSMHDLMAVLKKLDRSKNGVVVQHQFVSYFRHPEEY